MEEALVLILDHRNLMKICEWAYTFAFLEAPM